MFGHDCARKKEHKTIYVKFDFTGNDKNDSRPIKLAEEPIAVFTRNVEKYGKNKFVCNKSNPMKIKVSQKFLNNIKFTRTYDLKQEKSNNYTINLVEITENGDIFYYPNVSWGQIEYLE
ncbi:hypothetical protein EDM00_08440 [Ornithobacterium rhinotracheale]|nr:hypothetical protein [Ornithobacterium rhinotracheale]